MLATADVGENQIPTAPEKKLCKARPFLAELSSASALLWASINRCCSRNTAFC